MIVIPNTHDLELGAQLMLFGTSELGTTIWLGDTNNSITADHDKLFKHMSIDVWNFIKFNYLRFIEDPFMCVYAHSRHSSPKY